MAKIFWGFVLKNTDFSEKIDTKKRESDWI